jgi:hypothetical protein
MRDLTNEEKQLRLLRNTARERGRKVEPFGLPDLDVVTYLDQASIKELEPMTSPRVV